MYNASVCTSNSGHGHQLLHRSYGPLKKKVVAILEKMKFYKPSSPEKNQALVFVTIGAGWP